MTFRARMTRRRIVRLCVWGRDHAAAIHYAQVRPMKSVVPVNRWKTKALPITADCSESTTGIYKAAGAPDPNGLGYNGSGFTGTMRAHLPAIGRKSVRKGDLAVIGGGSGEHVVIFMQGTRLHRDPLVFSHGFEGGPLVLPLSQELGFHAGAPVTFHRGVPTDFRG